MLLAGHTRLRGLRSLRYLVRMPELSRPPRRRRGCLLRGLAALFTSCAVVGYLIMQFLTAGTHTPGCKVVTDRDDGEEYEFSPEQAVNAATITAVGTARGLPERAVTIALATALQESALRNIGHGDRDSLGLFQQRPSQGWGTERQIMDPVYAAGAFYDHLVKVPDYESLPLTVAAQKVQRSGYPDAYAKHEPDAAALAAALTGSSPASLTCQGTLEPGVVASPERVREALVRDFGGDAVDTAAEEVGDGSGGAASGETGRSGDSSPASPASSASPDSSASPAAASAVPAARVSGAEVTVPVSSGPKGRDAEERGWQVAHWAVAHASSLHIRKVTFAGLEWTAGNSQSAWRPVGGSSSSGTPGTGDGTKAVRILTAVRPG
jgi:hypothetical protein